MYLGKGQNIGTPADDSVDKNHLVAGYANGWVYLETKTPTAVNNINVDLPAGYDAFKFMFIRLAPGTDDQALHMRLSDDDGVTFEADVADYGWVQQIVHNLGGTEANTFQGDESDDHIGLFGDVAAGATNNPGSAAGETCNGEITIYDPLTSGKCQIIGAVNHITSDGELWRADLIAWPLVSAVYDAVQFLWEGATNFAAQGKIIVFGLRTDQT